MSAKCFHHDMAVSFVEFAPEEVKRPLHGRPTL